MKERNRVIVELLQEKLTLARAAQSGFFNRNNGLSAYENVLSSNFLDFVVWLGAYVGVEG